MLKSIGLAVLSVCLLLAPSGFAQEAPEPPVTLHVGDAAPPLSSASFVKGEAVKGFEKGKTYVVEFWATWCMPCRATIPHLSKLQQEYKDVTFIGQNIWEEDSSRVQPFVDKMGDKMNYRVAMDDTSDGSRGKMALTWMAAAGEHGIPTAFLVNAESKIAWIGYPMRLDEVLAANKAGTLDIKKESDRRDATNGMMKDLNVAMQSHDVDKAMSILDTFSTAHPDYAKDFIGLRYSLLLRKKNFPAALTMAKQIAESQKDEKELLSEVAWSMVNPDLKFEKPDLDLALMCALRADELSNHEADYVDTLAHVYAARGDVDKAIEVESQGLAKADDEDMKKELQKGLDEFKAKKAAK